MHEKLELWGLVPVRPRPDLNLPGSPERCVKRAAVEDHKGRVWMLERLHATQPERRQRIGALLDHLVQAGVSVPAYRALPGGAYVAEADGFHWQVSPYVAGTPLPQPDYVDYAERGEALGRFLADLDCAVRDFPDFAPEPDMTLHDFVSELMEGMQGRHPDVLAALAVPRQVLDPLFSAWAELPAVVRHGDFHPLNVIWQDRAVAAVVDWEFSGVRPRLYDLANCLGCVGIEDPDAFANGLAPAMLRVLRDRDCLDPASLELLPHLILGLRFAWMAEWLRRRDGEMVNLEIQYMRLLADNLVGLGRLLRHVLETG